MVQSGGGRYSVLNSFRSCLTDLNLGSYWTNGCSDSDWRSRVTAASHSAMLAADGAKMLASSRLDHTFAHMVTKSQLADKTID